MAIQILLAARYLFGRKLRTSLTTLAVAFATLLIFGMNILLPTMLDAFQTNLLAALGQVDVTVSHKTAESFAPSILNKVKAVPGVRVASGSLERTVNIPAGFFPKEASISAVSLVGIEPRAAQTLHAYTLREGRFLRPEDTAAAVISESLAQALGLRVGSDLRLPATEGAVKLRVIGLLPARTLPGNEQVLVTLDEAQKLLDLPNRINTIEANFVPGAQSEAVRGAIEARLGPDFTLGGLSSGGELMTSMQLGQTMFNMFGFLALFMGGFIIFNTFRTVVAERRHDIGMLRAIGAGRRTIAGLFLAEGLLQGSVGTLLGMLLGYLMALSIIVGLGPVWEQYLHISLGAPRVPAGLVVITAILGIGVTLLAGLMPAISASRLTPLEALRPPAVESKKRVISRGTLIGIGLIVLAGLGLFSGNGGLAGLGALAFLIGLALVTPVLIQPLVAALGATAGAVLARDGTGMLAEGNLVRQPGRAAVTASVTMIGLAIIITAAGVMTSIVSFTMGAVQRSLGSDYLLLPPAVGVWSGNVGAGQGLADRLRAIPGVGAVSTMRFASAQSNGTTISVLGVDPAVFPRVGGLSFQAGDPQAAWNALAGGRAVIANGIFAAQDGLKPGDVVRLSTPSGLQDYRVAAIASDFFDYKIPTVYTSQRTLRADFRKTEDIFIQLNLAPGADPATVEPRLKAALKRYPQFQLTSRQAYFEQTKQVFSASMGTLYILLVVLAVPSLIALLNALAIGVLERTREIGMLRAIGATRPQVRRVVIAEALLLAAIGTLLGMMAGLYLGYASVLGMSSAGFSLGYSFPTGGLIAAAVIGLCFGLLAALLPARQAARLEIVAALQYE